jgi:hypothetical protein
MIVEGQLEIWISAERKVLLRREMFMIGGRLPHGGRPAVGRSFLNVLHEALARSSDRPIDNRIEGDGRT